MSEKSAVPNMEAENSPNPERRDLHNPRTPAIVPDAPVRRPDGERKGMPGPEAQAERPQPDPAAETVIIPLGNPRLRPSVLLSCGHFTNVGEKRKQNQDSLLTMQAVKVNLSTPASLGLYVVADGMGGQASGELASEIVIAALARYAQAGLFGRFLNGDLTDRAIVDWLRMAVESANLSVLEGRVDHGNDMGSTVVVAVVKDNLAHIAHVGDSRAYRLDLDGALERLTHDHSLVEQLVLAKHITPAEARTHNQRNVVYRTMGEKENVEVDIRSFELQPGDRLILCSDGLNTMLEDDQITAIVRGSPGLMDAARRLIDAANDAGGTDNITVVIVEVVAA